MSSGCTVAIFASIDSSIGWCSGGVLMFGPPAVDRLAVDARLGNRGEDLARAGGRRGSDRGVDDLAPVVGQHRGGEGEIGVSRVHGRSDADLGEFRPGYLLDRDHVARALRL